MATTTKGRTEAWAADPVAFYRDVLLVDNLYPKQIEVLEAVRDNTQVAICGANGTGKDFLSGRLIAWWMSTRHPAICVALAPVSRQARIVWSELESGWLDAEQSTSPFALGGTLLENQWRISPNHYALQFSTDRPLRLQGYHSPNLLCLVTEAHALEQSYFDAIHRLQPHKLVLTGNPLSQSGEFFDCFHEKRGRWATVNISALDTPNVIQGREVIPGLVTREWVEERKEDWGEDSPLYIAAVLGEFPESLEDALIPLAAATAAAKREVVVDSTAPTVLSVDVARFGADQTVLLERQGNVARIVKTLQGADLMRTAGTVATHIDLHHPDQVVVDAVGIGAGVVDRLRELGYSVTAFNGGESPAGPTGQERFANRIAEVWWKMREWILAGEAVIPNDQALIGQLAGRKYAIMSDRKVKLESKEKLAKSPDKADALAMSFAPETGPQGLGIWFGNEPSVRRASEAKQALRTKERKTMEKPEILLKVTKAHEYQEPGSAGDFYRFDEGSEKWVPADVGTLLLQVHPQKFEFLERRNFPEDIPVEPVGSLGRKHH